MTGAFEALIQGLFMASKLADREQGASLVKANIPVLPTKLEPSWQDAVFFKHAMGLLLPVMCLGNVEGA